MVGTTTAAVAGTPGLIGERYAAFDLGYTDLSPGVSRGASVALNIPSPIRGLDLGCAVGYSRGTFSYESGEFSDTTRTRSLSFSATATGYLDLKGFRPFLSGSLGYGKSRMSGWSLEPTTFHPDGSTESYVVRDVRMQDSSFAYAIGAGLEIPVSTKAAVTLGVGYSDIMESGNRDCLTASIGANYWITEKIALRGSYARGIDPSNDSLSLGMALRF